MAFWDVFADVGSSAVDTYRNIRKEQQDQVYRKWLQDMQEKQHLLSKQLQEHNINLDLAREGREEELHPYRVSGAKVGVEGKEFDLERGRAEFEEWQRMAPYREQIMESQGTIAGIKADETAGEKEQNFFKSLLEEYDREIRKDQFYDKSFPEFTYETHGIEGLKRYVEGATGQDYDTWIQHHTDQYIAYNNLQLGDAVIRALTTPGTPSYLLDALVERWNKENPQQKRTKSDWRKVIEEMYEAQERKKKEDKKGKWFFGLF